MPRHWKFDNMTENMLPSDFAQSKAKQRLYKIIFETRTRAGRRFDLALLWLITASILVVILDSVPEIHDLAARSLLAVEWFFTIVFTVEYLLRIWSSPKPLKYIFSGWGLIDFIAIFPTYFSLIFPGSQSFMVVRALRLFRVFRILKLNRHVAAAQRLTTALRASVYKISAFLFAMLALVVIMGSIMYLVEGDENGFSSIPQGIYWAVITVTTVGYGDLVPQTVLGKFISSFIMIIGYSIIAVPTGIFTAEMIRSNGARKACAACRHKNELSARFCSHCGQAF